MSELPALVIAVPLLIAALLMALAKVLPRIAADILAIVTAAGTTAAAILLLQVSLGKTVVYWFGGWTPQHGVAVGIGFTIDPLSAGLAALVGLLVTAALIFAWRFFESVGSLFHALMLVFMTAMIGFCLTGDIFTMFVFFELMSVVAFALTGYKIEASSIEGALNFAITNSIGAFLTLWGIGLLYGRTGALNFAQLQRALATIPTDSIILPCFVLIASGYLIKAAVVPFHFWLGDAHAVAPTPVCVLFSGVMVELGVFGVFRVYWLIFEPALKPDEPKIRLVFLLLGVATSMLGAIMCFWQRHIKRLLAFSTISHIGIVLAGCGTLTARGLAGASMYLVGHALVKGSLFMSAGMLLQRFGSVDEIELRGRGREWQWIGIVVALAGLGLAGFPPFGTYQGKALIDEGVQSIGQRWSQWVFIAASALTSAAVLRGAARIFLGWGRMNSEAQRSPTEHEEKETRPEADRVPLMMIVTPSVMVLLPILFGLSFFFMPATEAAAERFMQSVSYSATVLDGTPTGPVKTAGSVSVGPDSIVLAFATALLAISIALGDLFGDRLPRTLARWFGSTIDLLLSPLRAIHSGDFRDYAAWLAIGVTIFGGAMAWALH
ncbi:MAG TPA: proton-conducting transporter membrane subunit [Chthoniobacterales bacterium]